MVEVVARMAAAAAAVVVVEAAAEAAAARVLTLSAVVGVRRVKGKGGLEARAKRVPLTRTVRNPGV